MQRDRDPVHRSGSRWSVDTAVVGQLVDVRSWRARRRRQSRTGGTVTESVRHGADTGAHVGGEFGRHHDRSPFGTHLGRVAVHDAVLCSVGRDGSARCTGRGLPTLARCAARSSSRICPAGQPGSSPSGERWRASRAHGEDHPAPMLVRVRRHRSDLRRAPRRTRRERTKVDAVWHAAENFEAQIARAPTVHIPVRASAQPHVEQGIGMIVGDGIEHFVDSDAVLALDAPGHLGEQAIPEGSACRPRVRCLPAVR